jgi:hypothetical protein
LKIWKITPISLELADFSGFQVALLYKFRILHRGPQFLEAALELHMHVVAIPGATELMLVGLFACYILPCYLNNIALLSPSLQCSF